MNEKIPFSRDSFLKQLNIIYIAIISGMFFFLIVIFVLKIQSPEPMVNKDSSPLFMYLPAIVIFIMPVGYFLYTNKIKEAKQQPTLDGKLQAYRVARFIKYAFFEMGGFIGLIGYLLTYSEQYLIITGVILIAYFMSRPSKFAIIRDLDLSKEEALIVENEVQ